MIWQVIQKSLISLFSFTISFNLAVNVRPAVILTSPGFWWWDTGPAASPEVWRLVAHGAQPDDCIYFREFIALLSATYCRDTQIAGDLASVCVVCYYCCPYVFQLSWNFQAISIKVAYSIYHGSCRATGSLCAHTPQKSPVIPPWRSLIQ